MIPGRSAAPSAGPSPASNITKNAEISANTERITANSHPHGWSVHSAPGRRDVDQADDDPHRAPEAPAGGHRRRREDPEEVEAEDPQPAKM